jgi:osmotically-inducible protein OsmY
MIGIMDNMALEAQYSVVKEAVVNGLVWLPELDPTDIDVTVDHGIVTLSGEIRCDTDRQAVLGAASRAPGVTGVVDHLAVSASSPRPDSDSDVEQRVRRRLATLDEIPLTTVSIAVQKGRVTITGEVEWESQRKIIEHAVERESGVVAVDNKLGLAARVSAADAAERIQIAILGDALREAASITVTADQNTLTLTGFVRSAHEQRRATVAAWSSPHVAEVHECLTVDNDGG